MFRINYGNGQVSDSFKSYGAARDELLGEVRRGDQYVAYFRIQGYDSATGDWVGLGKRGRPHLNDDGSLRRN